MKHLDRSRVATALGFELLLRRSPSGMYADE